MVLEVEFQQNSLSQESVLLNQRRKVANLSDRGYELRSEVCDMVTSQLSCEPAGAAPGSCLKLEPAGRLPVSCSDLEPAGPIPVSCSTIWGSGASVELCVYDASRLKWFPLESERCPLSIKPMGSEVVRVLSVEGWSLPSIKPMGSGCAMILNIDAGVLGLVVIQGQPFVYVIGQQTVCKQLRRTSNFSEEFESGNGANVRTEPNWSIELAVSISPGGPEPSSPMSNRPTQSVAQQYACGDARKRDNLPASSLICPDSVELPLRWIV